MRSFILVFVIFISCASSPENDGTYSIRLSFSSEAMPSRYSSYIEIIKDKDSSEYYNYSISYHDRKYTEGYQISALESDSGVVSSNGNIIYSFTDNDTLALANLKPDHLSLPYECNKIKLLEHRSFMIGRKNFTVYKYYEDNGGSIESDSYSFYLKGFGVILIQKYLRNSFYKLDSIIKNNTEIKDSELLLITESVYKDSTFCVRRPKRFVPD